LAKQKENLGKKEGLRDLGVGGRRAKKQKSNKRGEIDPKSSEGVPVISRQHTLQSVVRVLRGGIWELLADHRI